MKLITRIVFLLIFVFMSQYSYASEDKKYQNFLFPEGMPTKEGWDGKQRKAVYDFYSEAQISGQPLFVILYSVKTITGHSDDLYAVFVSTISTATKKPMVIYTEDITKHVTVFTEVPGNFYRMKGLVEIFNISDIKKGVHANLWAVISGAGGISSSTDLFYLIEPNFSIRQILMLKDTSSFSKMRRGTYKNKSTFVYYLDINGDKNTELALLETDYDVDEEANVNNFSFEPRIRVYNFTGDNYVFFKDLKVFEDNIPTLIPFGRSDEISFKIMPAIRKLFSAEIVK